MAEVPALRVPEWEAVPGLWHGFLGRHGGVSVGPFATLNLAERTGDDPHAVTENYRRVDAALAPGARLIRMHQVHGDRVVAVEPLGAPVGAADAMVTTCPGATLGILTADCVPILLLARQRRAVAAVHAGWRGTVAGIVTRAVAMLRSTFGVEPAEVEAALGPAIGGCCYEIEREIGERFIARWGLADGAWTVRGGAGMLDLRRANHYLLRCAGVAERNIGHVGPCTRCAAADYFSHRGSDGQTGRQLSYIGWAR